MQPGDRVYQVPGAFGTPATIWGRVVAGGRVKIEGGASLLGVEAVHGAGRTVPLTGAWRPESEPTSWQRMEEASAARDRKQAELFTENERRARVRLEELRAAGAAPFTFAGAKRGQRIACVRPATPFITEQGEVVLPAYYFEEYGRIAGMSDYGPLYRADWTHHDTTMGKPEASEPWCVVLPRKTRSR